MRLYTFEEFIREHRESPFPADGLNEDLGNWLHLGVDVISAMADSVVPGSGATIDIVHAIEYFIQAELQDKDEEAERVALNLSGVITLASVALIGPLQAAAVALKRELGFVVEAFKKGASSSTINLAKRSVESARSHIQLFLKWIEPLAKWLGTKIKELSRTGLGQWLVGKFGSLGVALDRLNRFLTVSVPGAFTSFLKMLAALNPIGVGAAGAEGTELAFKQAAKNWAASRATSTVSQSVANATELGAQEKGKVGQAPKG